VLYLANPSTDAIIAAMHAGVLGLLDQPGQRALTRVGGVVPWAADNGCFAKRWDEASWWRFLWNRRAHVGRCLFAAVPDVLGDAAATRVLFAEYAVAVRGLGFPVAYVAQDGSDVVAPPWDQLDVLFVGGSTIFKLGPVARALISQAHGRGKRVHFGRVNSGKRFEYARALGAHTCDGTFMTIAPDTNLPRLLRWLDKSQPVLFNLGGNE
jgi:hypothetical protein